MQVISCPNLWILFVTVMISICFYVRVHDLLNQSRWQICCRMRIKGLYFMKMFFPPLLWLLQKMKKIIIGNVTKFDEQYFSTDCFQPCKSQEYYSIWRILPITVVLLEPLILSAQNTRSLIHRLVRFHLTLPLAYIIVRPYGLLLTRIINNI